MQQVGSAEEIYSSPVKALVASFLGEANLLKAVVAKKDGRYIELSLPAGGTMLAKDDKSCCTGEQVQIFVHPEAITFNDVQGGGLRGVVEQKALQGETTRLQVRLRDGSLVAVNAARVGTAGQNLAPPLIPADIRKMRSYFRRMKAAGKASQ